MRKIAFFLFAIVTLCANAYDVKIDGIFYNLSGSEASVTYDNRGVGDYSGQVSIPASITYQGKSYRVTSIGDDAFFACYKLTSVHIPGSVKKIGSGSFASCTGLSRINLPANLTEIGFRGFADCSALTSVDLPGSLTQVGNYAFQACSSLKSVAWPASLTVVPRACFERCTSLTKVSLPAGVTEIQQECFRECTSLQSINIPAGVTTMGRYAFYATSSLESITLPAGCDNLGDNLFRTSGLKHITLPSTLKTLPNYIFQESPKLTEISIPAGVTAIPTGAFYNCRSLRSIELYEGITQIKSEAFKYCRSVTSISLPSSLSKVDFDAFQGCYVYQPNLRNASSVDPTQYGLAVYTEEDPSGLLRLDAETVACRPWATKVTIPEGVTTIADHGFATCASLTSVKLPSTLTTIAGSAFLSCSALASIDFPASLRSISWWAFAGCKSLKKVSLPEGLTEISDGAFQDCTSLTHVDLPSTLLMIPSQCFDGCTALQTMTIAEGLKVIDRYAFRNCSSLTSLTLPSTLTAIRDYALQGVTLHPLTILSPSLSDLYGTGIFWGFEGEIMGPNSIRKDLVDHGFPAERFYATDYFLPGHNAKPLLAGFILDLCYMDYYGVSDLTFSTYDHLPLKTQRLEDNRLLVTGLPIDKYTMVQFSYTDREGHRQQSEFELTTLKPTFTTKSTNTQSYCDIEAIVPASDESIQPTSPGFLYGSQQITTFPYRVDNLYPGQCYSINRFAYYNGELFMESKSVNHYAASLKLNVSVVRQTPTTVELSYSHTPGNATLKDEAVYLNYNQTLVGEASRVIIKGLEPGTRYDVVYSMYANDKYFSVETRFDTPSLELQSLQPKVVTEGNVIVAASTNVSEEETGLGFEWRRTDWTDDFNSNTGSAYVFDGTMEGYIRNLNANYLWKYRPYYVTSRGKYYYGDWVGIDPTNTSYFEPTVRTYSDIVLQGNTAQVKGYVLRGSDPVKIQGFIYWKNAGYTSFSTCAALAAVPSPLLAPSIPADALTVEASGQIMTATLPALTYGTEYTCVAFVTTTEGETFYGQPQTFYSGDDPDAIDEIHEDSPSSVPSTILPGYYDLNGRRVDSPTHGIYILRLEDGTARKILKK